MTQVALSVIVPAYRPKRFDALMASMAANLDVDAEWIVVDDGSGPEFDAVFDGLPDQITLLRQSENRRQGAARNSGLAAARGRWVKFLDADDMLDTGHLAALLAAAEKAPEGAIPFAPTRHVFAGGRTLVNDSWRDLPLNPHSQFLRQLVRPFLHHCGALFPRDLLRRVGGYDKSLITDEDGDLLLRVMRDGSHFVPVEGVHYLYVHHEEGDRVSSDNDIGKLNARIQVCEKLQAGFDEPLPRDVANALAQRMDKIAMSYWANFPDEAQALVERACKLAPGYVPDMRGPLRILRRLGGPKLAVKAQALFRRLKGRPKGGAQG